MVLMGIMIICPEEAPRFIKIHGHPSTFFTYHQHAVLYVNIFTYHHITKLYELTINISLNTANLNVINISSPEFRIWQHVEDHWNRDPASPLG